ncbi:hypothetical protein Dimus_032949 [Dionaea muscipula]
MAMVRRLTASRSERYLGTYGSRGYAGAVTDEPDFREEDVWSIVDGEDDDGDRRYAVSAREWSARSDYGSGKADVGAVMSSHRRRTDSRQVGGLSLAFEEGKTASSRIVHQYRGVQENGVGGVGDPPPPRRHHMATSAPVNVPDWNRILRVNSVESLQESDDCEGSNGVDDLESEEGWAPPHEYLARSRKSAAMSAFEGVGRTLKGRDMSRLRDAVWSQTGFDG